MKAFIHGVSSLEAVYIWDLVFRLSLYSEIQSYIAANWWYHRFKLKTKDCLSQIPTDWECTKLTGALKNKIMKKVKLQQLKCSLNTFCILKTTILNEIGTYM